MIYLAHNRGPVISGIGKILSDINQIILKSKKATYFNRFSDVPKQKTVTENVENAFLI